MNVGPRLSRNPAHPSLADAQAARVAADFADVSHYQDHPDWDKYAASGRKMAVCKESEGTSQTDDSVGYNRAALSRLGLTCGLYHFAGNSGAHKIGDPVKEADFYLSQVGTMGEKEFPVLDFELTYKLKPAQQVDWVDKWCHRVEEKTGKTPWIYTNSSMKNSWPAESLTHFPLWVANYNGSDPKNPPSSAPWPKLVAWQFTDKSPTPGIGNCDGSFFYGTA